MTNDSKQLIIFLLGKETGEVVQLFKDKKITKSQYDKECCRLHAATEEMLKLTNLKK